MTYCDQRNDDNRGPLICTRTDAHEHGHVFVASVGADLSDERAEES